MSCSDLLPYTLPIIINTRPVERATALTHYLTEAGFSVVEMPMLTLQDRALSDCDIRLMRCWLAGDYKALVIVSPTAAALGLSVWRTMIQQRHALDVSDNECQVEAVDTLSLSAPSQLIAVGTATAKVLQKAKLATTSYEVLQPTIANNEGMLAMPEIEQLQAGDKLLVWRGIGGRRLLVDTLQSRGIHIDSIAWYERLMPDMAKANYRQWLQQFSIQHERYLSQSKPVVIISSGTAFEHWANVVNDACMTHLDHALDQNVTLADFTYIVLGARLAEMISERHLNYYRVEDLLPKTILAAIQS